MGNMVEMEEMKINDVSKTILFFQKSKIILKNKKKRKEIVTKPLL
jgi:hypothetical protein